MRRPSDENRIKTSQCDSEQDAPSQYYPMCPCYGIVGGIPIRRRRRLLERKGRSCPNGPAFSSSRYCFNDAFSEHYFARARKVSNESPLFKVKLSHRYVGEMTYQLVAFLWLITNRIFTVISDNNTKDKEYASYKAKDKIITKIPINSFIAPRYHCVYF